MDCKISFLTQFQPFLNTLIKTVAYLKHHLACHHWSNKFKNHPLPLPPPPPPKKTNTNKHTQKKLKMIVSAGRKFKIENYMSDIYKNCQVSIPT